MLVFSTGFVNYCLLSGYLPPSPLPCVNKYTVHVYSVRGEVWYQRRGGGLRHVKHLPQSPFTGQFFFR
jgi:hypothetical protein